MFHVETSARISFFRYACYLFAPRAGLDNRQVTGVLYLGDKMTREIKLTQGQVAIVDDGDYECLSRNKWHYDQGYAKRTIWKNGINVHVFMHRQILGFPSNAQIYHIDRNGLNNQRENLRLCTGRQNAHNRKLRSDTNTGFKGVTRYGGRYKARITVNGKRLLLGHFDRAEDAHKAYVDAAKSNFGEFFREE